MASWGLWYIESRMKNSRVGVIGCGYVGLAYVALLSKHNAVVAYDVNQDKLAAYQRGEYNLAEKALVAELVKNQERIEYRYWVPDAGLAELEIFFVCVPTNYDESKHQLNTAILNDVIAQITHANPNALIVIKSTIPFGYTDEIIKRVKNPHIVFMPEFLREGKSFYDLKHPSRIILGCDEAIRDRANQALKAIGLIGKKQCYLVMSAKEAESVKLFANTYLAMRVAYFNELDNFAAANQLDVKNMIDGICADSRIGNFYNNPSFGFGGYCLEKDTKQCAELFNENVLIRHIVDSNNTRKQLVLQQILQELKALPGVKHPTVGIYGLGFKHNSDNHRNSAMIDLLQGLQAHQINVVVFEENLPAEPSLSCPVMKDFDAFVKTADLIVANRHDQRTKNLPHVFSRDIFGEN